jgi:hypothetical protein
MPPKQANIVTGVDPKISYTTHTRYNTTDSLCRRQHHINKDIANTASSASSSWTQAKARAEDLLDVAS